MFFWVFSNKSWWSPNRTVSKPTKHWAVWVSTWFQYIYKQKKHMIKKRLNIEKNPQDHHIFVVLLLIIWQVLESESLTKRNISVSENSGTPKSSILIGFSIINHPFGGTLIFGNTHISFLVQRLPTNGLFPTKPPFVAPRRRMQPWCRRSCIPAARTPFLFGCKNNHTIDGWKYILSSWWFQRTWKILVKLDHFPR